MPKYDSDDIYAPTPRQIEEYASLMHRMQSAIAFFEGRKETLGERNAECEPKHLRVGVNSALVETSALARLLMAKGVITSKEYFDAIIKGLRTEVNSYQDKIWLIDPRIQI